MCISHLQKQTPNHNPPKCGKMSCGSLSVSLIPFLFNIIVLLLLFFNLLLILTIAGASAASKGNGQPAARRTAAEGAYAGGATIYICI